MSILSMFESGFWIFLVEGAVAGLLFTGLIWWVVGGTKKRDYERLQSATKLQQDGVVTEVVPAKPAQPPLQ